MQETGLRIKLKAMFDKSQVQKEATEVVDTAQKTLDKKQLKLNIENNLVDLKKKLEETRIAYQNLLNQPMNWTTDRQLQQLEDQMEDLRNAIKSDEQALADLWKTSTKTSNLLWNLVAKISALAIAWKALSFLKNTFNEFQQSQSKIIQATWATGEALQQLTKDMLAVQWNVKQSQWEIAEAVGELNTRLGLSWEELQNFTTKYLQFASITGQDWKQAIADNIKMFNIWGVATEKQADYLDKLVIAWQKTWISVSELTNQLQTYAPVLQELGFSLEDSIALLSNFEQAWVEASQVLQSMKMWLKNLADDWIPPSQALEEVIKGVRDWTLSLSDAMDIFWSRGGVAMYNAIKNGTFALDEMKDSLDNVSWAVEGTYNEMETLWEFISRKWNWLVADFINWNNEGFQATRKLYHIIKDELTPEVEKASKTFENWTTAFYGRIRWEREFTIVNWQLVSVLTQEGIEMEKAKKKQEELNRVLTNYNTTLREAIDAVNTFDKTKVDDSKTRAEFERDRQQAIATMQAFRNAYIEKLRFFDSADTGKWKSFTDLSKIISLDRDIMKARTSVYTWKDKEDWWALGEELLWWKGSWGGGWWWKSKAQEMLEEFDKELTNTWGDLDSFVKDHQKTYDDLNKSIKKVEEEYWKLQGKADDMRQSLEKSVRNYNEQLEKNQTDSLEKLGQRYVELKEKRAEIDNDYLKRIVGDISSSDWRLMRDEGYTFKWYDYNELKDIKELYDEIKLIEENTTEEQRKTAEFTEKTSRAQEILNAMKEKEAQLEEQKAIAIEKQKIAVAVMNQEMWKELIQTLTKNWEDIGTWYYDIENEKREQIHNIDNLEYAKQLEQQFQELNNQKAQLESEKNEEVEVLADATARKIQLEQQYSKVYEESIKNQKKGLDELIAKTQELINKRREYLSMWWGSSHNAYWWSVLSWHTSIVGENGPEQIIARQSSYVQPRNASNSYSTVNNDNSFSINWINVNVSNIDEFLDELKQKMTYRN